MKLGKLFFSFRGRLNRAKYWLSVLVFALGWQTSVILDNRMGLSAVGAIILLATVVSSVSIAIRRLHDRNRSGWWLLLFYLAPSALIAAAVILSIQGSEASVATIRQGIVAGSGLALLFAFSAITIWIWGFIELGLRRGTAGPNRFGNDPLEKQM